MNYFDRENETCSQLQSGLTDKLAKDIQRFWKSDVFQEMLKCNLNPKYFSSIAEIVGWFHSEDKVLEVDDTSESNDEMWKTLSMRVRNPSMKL